MSQPSGAVPGHLNRAQISRAVRALERGTETYYTMSGCSLQNLPLEVDFSDYTVDVDGTIIEDGGWTPEEVDQLSGFLCRMLPIIRDLYGRPYKRYTVHYVKDLAYSNTNIFVPATESIHSAGGWFPQLIAHEFVHAFRWQKILSSDPKLPWIYDPKYSGFEEGFAQAVSFEAMNQYVDTYGSGDPYVDFYVWSSDNEWRYDFRDDASMITEDFWSEDGGTLKSIERYEHAAAAIRKLAILIPGFYELFNLFYYTLLEAGLQFDPFFSADRDDFIHIISILAPVIEGKTAQDWINEQEIFRCENQHGKKIWFREANFTFTEPHTSIYFVENFPNGYEWAYKVPSHSDYLYHRLNGTSGTLTYHPAWEDSWYSTHTTTIQDRNWWGSWEACGINCAKGFGLDILQFYQDTPPTGFQVDNPIVEPHPSEPGLYQIDVSFDNPHYTESDPLYDIMYDSDPDQETLSATHYRILGLEPSVLQNDRVTGGIVGMDSGTVQIEHSEVPGLVKEYSIDNGIFHDPGPEEWFKTVLDGSWTVSKPGVLRFTFRFDSQPLTTYHAERIIDMGHIYEGKHYFLFRLEEMYSAGPGFWFKTKM